MCSCLFLYDRKVVEKNFGIVVRRIYKKGSFALNIEHKLNLIQQIHKEQEENERYIYNNLRQRNYHKIAENGDDFYGGYKDNFPKDLLRTDVQTLGGKSLRFRLLVAILLFLCFFVMDKKKIVYMEVGSNDIIRYISENIEIPQLDDLFVENRFPTIN